jgi:hypothetical protein
MLLVVKMVIILGQLIKTEYPNAIHVQVIMEMLVIGKL